VSRCPQSHSGVARPFREPDGRRSRSPAIIAPLFEVGVSVRRAIGVGLRTVSEKCLATTVNGSVNDRLIAVPSLPLVT